MIRIVILAALAAFAGKAAQAAPVVRPSLVDSFRLGAGGDTLCRVQGSPIDPAAPGLFDRGYAIVCRDAAAPVGRLYALRMDHGDPATRLASARDPAIVCRDVGVSDKAEAGAIAARDCRTPTGLGYTLLSTVRGRTLYAAEGLTGYRSALELGLRSLVADRVVAGPIAIALTQAGDAASFARAQAGSLDPTLALAEGYRRNNSGNYAEASEFFDTLLQRDSARDGPSRRRLGEYLVNRALQQSDLGNFGEADALFAQALALPTSDPVELRLQRNYRALNLLNQQQADEALRVIDAPLDAAPVATGAGATIDAETASALDTSIPIARQLGISQNVSLTPAEKVVLLDDQALALRGTILRLRGRPREAAEAFQRVLTSLDTIREGRVTSIARLRAQVMTDQATLAEDAGDQATARRLLDSAVTVLSMEYPASIAHDAAEARLAGFLARRGRADEALALYRKVALALSDGGGATSGFAGLLDPYFALLVAKLPEQPALDADLFVASQVMLRSGVASTQATLARELAAGSDDAGRLFRQSLNETRQVEILRVELARLNAIPNPTAQDRAGIAADLAQLRDLGGEQTATQARLAQYPAYRAIATQALPLSDFRAVLKPGEAYWKLTVVGPSIYGLYITPTETRAWKLPFGSVELARRVDALRATITSVRDGRQSTVPFDVAGARALYVGLTGPIAAELPRVRHLIFEPDGAMLRLPATLLIAEQAGADRYLARARDARADPFDTTGIAWLGATVDVSTALSPRSFRDVRAAAASQAPRAYLGFGRNAPVDLFAQLTSYVPPTSAIDCRWPLSTWSHPVSDAELIAARGVIGGAQSTIATGAAFTDSDIAGRDDLARYRILHFATHGLVTAPRAQCPAQPALLTSFGGSGSKGLLDFATIYGLHLDADLVILSACDTAGAADVSATRAAGIASGGGNALDGLVRAFIGAGGRSVLASHWPAPDDYRATERLIGGLFTAPRGTSLADALRAGQIRLMADPATSHPYYWAGFAIIGDGARTVLREP